jgi:hypothetical protein
MHQWSVFQKKFKNSLQQQKVECKHLETISNKQVDRHNID